MPSATTRRRVKGRPRRWFEAVGLVLLLAAPFVLADAHDGLVGPKTRHYVADTLLGARWDAGAVDAEWTARPFWVEPVRGNGVRVAIIDTGIDATHPDLRGSVVGWRDFLEARPTPYDDDAHGTHVAGIIAARGHLQPDPFAHYFPFGATGVAPGVELLVAKAMDRDGNGDATTVAAAVRWALDPNGDGDPSDGAHVINLSIGIETPEGDGDDLPFGLPTVASRSASETKVLEDAIRTAYDMGAVVVVAAGNHDPDSAHDQVTFPGTMREVITVGALDGAGHVATFSNRGAPESGKPDLVAPGIILSTFPKTHDTVDGSQDGYLALGGTSMASPMVAGTVALMMEADPSLKGLSAEGGRGGHTERMRAVLQATAVPAGPSEAAGAGALRVDAAVATIDVGEGGLAWGRIMVALTLLVLVVVVSVRIFTARRDKRRRRTALRAAQARRAARSRYDPAPAPVWAVQEEVLVAGPGRAMMRVQARPVSDER
ncbi:MAG: S8 family serine peptidase [Euryarchaeota archaeon]|nr:S8 family serine peptidase [Euryarchaeota archaeon]